MREIEVPLSSLYVTEDCHLDLDATARVAYLLSRGDHPMDPLVVVKDGYQTFVVDGHHRGYGLLANSVHNTEALLLETDEDVRNCQLGKARDYNTLKELQDACASANTSGAEDLGITQLSDYLVRQRCPSAWGGPVVHLVSLNPSLEIHGEDKIPGGKAVNVASGMRGLGFANLCLYALLGGDNGGQLKKSLYDAHVPLIQRPTLDETLSVTVTGREDKRRSAPENPRVRGGDLAGLEASLKGAIREGDILVLSGSLPRDISPTYFAELTSYFASQGIKVVFDSSNPEAFAVVVDQRPYLIKPNRDELSRYLGEPVNGNITTTARVTDAFRREKNINTVLLSLDCDGALLVRDQGIFYARPQVEREKVCCTIGAGDALLSGYLTSSLSTERPGGRRSLKDHLAYAVATASAHVQRRRVEGIDKKLIDKLLPKIRVERISL